MPSRASARSWTRWSRRASRRRRSTPWRRRSAGRRSPPTPATARRYGGVPPRGRGPGRPFQWGRRPGVGCRRARGGVLVRRPPAREVCVVWGRDVNVLLAGLATQMLAAPPGSDQRPLQDALRRTVAAVDRSGLRQAELWSYRIDAGRLIPERYGTSSDVQLWSLTDLAVEYLLVRLPQP